jgi:predicted transcriptional regulator
MLTVRFPNGQVVQYNDANELFYADRYWELFQDKNRVGWVASIQVTAGVIVERHQPCAVYNPIEREAGDRRDALLKRILNLMHRVTTQHKRVR